MLNLIWKHELFINEKYGFNFDIQESQTTTRKLDSNQQVKKCLFMCMHVYIY